MILEILVKPFTQARKKLVQVQFNRFMSSEKQHLLKKQLIVGALYDSLYCLLECRWQSYVISLYDCVVKTVSSFLYI